MKIQYAAYAFVLALATIPTAQAASHASPTADRQENPITDFLNRQQLDNNGAGMSEDAPQPNPSAGMPATMSEDIAQPNPSAGIPQAANNSATAQPQALKSPDKDQLPHTLTNFRSFQ